MILIGIVYLVSFCGHLDVAPTDVISELRVFVKRIFWTSWNTLNNTKFNPDFCQYDYGRAKNLLIYDSAEPPNYDLANIMVSNALFYGSGDTLVDIVDVKRLHRILPNIMDVYEVPWPNFNHADFVLAKDAPKLVYDRVLEIMRKENLNNVTSSTKIKDKCYTLNLYQ